MPRIALLFACAALIASSLMVHPAGAKEAGVQAHSGACGRDSHLEAARDALARGERDVALEHLRRAEAQLDACAHDESTTPEQTPVHAEPALAFRLEAQPLPSLLVTVLERTRAQDGLEREG